MHILYVHLEEIGEEKGLLAHCTSGTLTAEAQDLVSLMEGAA